MTERMSDERLAELEEIILQGNECDCVNCTAELVDYFKAERQRVKELERGIAESCDDMRFEYAGCERAEAAEANFKQQREMVSQLAADLENASVVIDEQAGRAKAAEAQLAAVRGLQRYEASPYELIPERPFDPSVGAYWKVVMADELEALLNKQRSDQ